MADPSDAVRILYATPDAAAIAFVRSVLQAEGWPLEAVADADRCLSRFEKGAPDVVIADVALPDIAGLDLVGEIHAIDASVPVILVASPASIEQSVVAMRLGAESYLAQPLDKAKLVATVREASRASGRSARSSASRTRPARASPRSGSTRSSPTWS